MDGLRESIELESQADLMAVACNFGEAFRLMKAANALRAAVFGRGLDPNHLRLLTAQALAAQAMSADV